MKNTSRLLSNLLAGLMLISIIACGGKNRGYKSPEKAYQAMKNAVKKKDFEQAVRTYTPEGVKQLAEKMMVTGVMIMMSDKDAKQEIAHIMKKHGLSRQKVARAKQKDKMPELGNPAAFVGDMMNYLSEQGKISKTAHIAQGRLTDLKITGDTARGTVKRRHKGEEMNFPITFCKTKTGWMIDPYASIKHSSTSQSNQPEEFFEADRKPQANALHEGVKLGIHLSYQEPQGGMGLSAVQNNVLYARIAMRSGKFSESCGLKSITVDTAATGAGKEAGLILERSSDKMEDDAFKTASLPGTFTPEQLPRRVMDQSMQGTVIRLVLPFEAPEESAESFSLKGKASLLTGGKEEKVTIANLSSKKTGDTLSHKALKELGLSARLSKAVEGKSVTVKMQGPVSLVKDYELVDSKGNTIDIKSSGGSSNKQMAVQTINASQNLPSGVGLRLTLVTDRSVQEVPFEFNNLKLPSQPAS